MNERPRATCRYCGKEIERLVIPEHDVDCWTGVDIGTDVCDSLLQRYLNHREGRPSFKHEPAEESVR